MSKSLSHAIFYLENTVIMLCVNFIINYVISDFKIINFVTEPLEHFQKIIVISTNMSWGPGV